MNRLSNQERSQVIAALVESASIDSVVRMTGASKPTILKLLADLGTACAKYQDEKLRNLPCKRVQCDEIWSFCFAKDKNLSDDLKGKFGFGSVWTIEVFMYYNFARIHSTLRVTPAIEAGVSKHVWSIEEIVGLI